MMGRTVAMALLWALLFALLQATAAQTHTFIKHGAQPQ